MISIISLRAEDDTSKMTNMFGVTTVTLNLFKFFGVE